jgi:hypothetical protein
MKRVAGEWSVIVFGALSVATALLWADGRCSDRPPVHLRFPPGDDVRDELHVLVGGGTVAVCNRLDGGPFDPARPMVVEWRTYVPPPAATFRSLTLPGVDFRYCRVAAYWMAIWSVTASLLVPAALFALAAALSQWSLRRRAQAPRASTASTSV